MAAEKEIRRLTNQIVQDPKWVAIYNDQQEDSVDI